MKNTRASRNTKNSKNIKGSGNNKYSIQSLINDKLLNIMHIENYKTKDIKTKIKNTFNIYCPVCGSDNVHDEMKQLRSGDEEANHIYTCLNCGTTKKDAFLTHPLKS